MNQPDWNGWDGAIDKVLAGLRDIEPAPGLERGILDGLEHRPTQRWSWSPLVNWMAAGGLALAMMIISILAAALHQPSRVHEPNLPSAQAPQSTVARVDRATAATVSHRTRQTRRAAVPHDVSPEPLLFAAGSAAPSIPLTDQEKLLLQVARRGENSPAPTLDPDQLARREAEAEAAFGASLASLPDAAAHDVEPRLPEVDRKGESQ